MKYLKQSGEMCGIIRFLLISKREWHNPWWQDLILAIGQPAKCLLCLWGYLGYLENDGKAIICHERIQIPYVLQHNLLARLHSAHMAQNSTLAVAKAKYFWPKMRHQIESMALKCLVCIKYGHYMPNEKEIIQSSDSLPYHTMD